MVAVTAVIVVIAVYGISRIQVNDNPVKWFTEGHEIRVADRVFNSHFGGTYEAYLILQPPSGGKKEIERAAEAFLKRARKALEEGGRDQMKKLRKPKREYSANFLLSSPMLLPLPPTKESFSRKSKKHWERSPLKQKGLRPIYGTLFPKAPILFSEVLKFSSNLRCSGT